MVKKQLLISKMFLDKNGPFPATFSFIFGLFKHQYNFLQQTSVKNDPSSMRYWDSNSRPLGHESATITTRPGLPPLLH